MLKYFNWEKYKARLKADAQKVPVNYMASVISMSVVVPYLFYRSGFHPAGFLLSLVVYSYPVVPHIEPHFCRTQTHRSLLLLTMLLTTLFSLLAFEFSGALPPFPAALFELHPFDYLAVFCSMATLSIMLHSVYTGSYEIG